MLTLVGLAMLVLSLVGFRRVSAVQARQLKPNDFALGESAAVPATVSLPNRNFMNLMEVPVLFYVVCLTFYITGKVDTAALVLAWLFVVARAGHSAVHLLYNNVWHRLLFFATGNLLVFALWGHLLLKL